MVIKFKCHRCGLKLQNDESMGGKEDVCPGCGIRFQTPLSRNQVAEKKRAELEKAAHDKAKRESALVAEAASKSLAAQQRREALIRKKESIVISTGGVSQEHSVLQIIFAAGVQEFGGKGFFTRGVEFITDQEYNAMIEQVYNSAIDIFRTKAVKVGADAVIHSRFDIEQIELGERGLVTAGNALRIQVFCTGTAVKFV